MVTLTLYHATERERGNQIQQSCLFPETVGDHHWLGDGSYFFLEGFHAYKWMLDMYKSRFSHIINYDELYKHYKIIQTTIELQDSRLFNLMLVEHKILFDVTYKELIKIDRSIIYRAPEGKVLNYMFQSLQFNQDYDCVLSLFGFNRGNYSGTKSRIGFMPQLQLCIKNGAVLVDTFEEYDYTEHLETFDYLLSNYYFEQIKRG